MGQGCEAGGCGVSCNGGCACWADADNPNDCHCSCSPPRSQLREEKYSLYFDSLDKEIDLFTKDFPFIELAHIFEKITPYRLSIPTRSLNTNVTVRITRVPLGEVLKDIGFFIHESSEDCEGGCGKGDFRPTT
jgi:hypothetical protein